LKAYKYKTGDLILVRHKSMAAGVCLVLGAKKRISCYEVKVYSRGKVFTIVDDGNFYITSLISEANNEKRTSR